MVVHIALSGARELCCLLLILCASINHLHHHSRAVDVGVFLPTYTIPGGVAEWRHGRKCRQGSVSSVCPARREGNICPGTELRLPIPCSPPFSAVKCAVRFRSKSPDSPGVGSGAASVPQVCSKPTTPWVRLGSDPLSCGRGEMASHRQHLDLLSSHVCALESWRRKNNSETSPTAEACRALQYDLAQQRKVGAAR